MGSSDRSTPTRATNIRGDPGASSSTLTPPLRASTNLDQNYHRRYSRNNQGANDGGRGDVRRRNTNAGVGSPRAGSRNRDRIAEEDDEFPNRPYKKGKNSCQIVKEKIIQNAISSNFKYFEEHTAKFFYDMF